MKHPNVSAALAILTELGFPRAQLNLRSALTLLALADVSVDQSFSASAAPLMGITPIMDWVRDHYGTNYAPNTRETFRRQTMHQFLDAGLVLYNPDKPDRPVNSPKAAYQLTPQAVTMLRRYGTRDWASALRSYIELSGELAARYARARAMELIPVLIDGGCDPAIESGRAQQTHPRHH